MIEQWQAIEVFGVRGSPHVFLRDGTDVFHPGVELHWERGHGEGFPVIDVDDPSAYDEILRRAAS